MCDTFVTRRDGLTWFAKNSDREPDEPQRLIFLDAVRGDTERTVRCTYLDIPQSANRHALVLSRPSWLWGGEMGINEHGVAIGNEAVFGKLVDKKGQALLGMDLLRLGLERGASAREALAVITQLLEAHGQGGAGGYRDKRFRYDNAFIIADRHEAWVLETAGRLWAAKRVEQWAISNCYSLGHEFDLSSPDLPGEAKRRGVWNGKGDFHFAQTFDTKLYAWIGGAHQRRALNTRAMACLPAADWAALRTRLRDHGAHHDDYAQHDNRQVCLHAGSLLRPSQTTASLIARLAPGELRYAATGTSAPCLSLFQPEVFGPLAHVEADRWEAFEPVHHRALFDPIFRKSLIADRNRIEAQLFAGADSAMPDWGAIAHMADEWRRDWRTQALAKATAFTGRYGRYWKQVAAREAAAS